MGSGEFVVAIDFSAGSYFAFRFVVVADGDAGGSVVVDDWALLCFSVWRKFFG